MLRVRSDGTLVVLLADKPGLSWKQALNGSLSFALARPLDMLVLALLAALLATAGALCVVGFLITGPLSAALVWMAYEGNRAQIEASEDRPRLLEQGRATGAADGKQLAQS